MLLRPADNDAHGIVSALRDQALHESVGYVILDVLAGLYGEKNHTKTTTLVLHPNWNWGLFAKS